MERKKIGYYISKGKCLMVYSVKKMNKRTRRTHVKKVNSKGKVIRKGTKIYKRKTDCEKKLRKMKKVKSRSSVRKTRKATKSRRSKFGQTCSYNVPYFGSFVPSISKTSSGTPDTGMSSIAWAWPTPPSALGLDKQQGTWLKTK